MSAPSRRRRGLRRLRAASRGIAVLCFVGAAVGVARFFSHDASPIPATAALYVATVAYGLSEMAALRERHLFRPGRAAPTDSALLWWALRIPLVIAVSTLPAALLLGGLTR